MSEQSPSPLHDDCLYAVLVALGKNFVIGDRLMPEYAHNFIKVLVWKVDSVTSSFNTLSCLGWR